MHCNTRRFQPSGDQYQVGRLPINAGLAPQFAGEGKHGVVVCEHIGMYVRDTVSLCDRNQGDQQVRTQSHPLPRIGDDDGDFTSIAGFIRDILSKADDVGIR